jgi:hypothetical protein
MSHHQLDHGEMEEYLFCATAITIGSCSLYEAHAYVTDTMMMIAISVPSRVIRWMLHTPCFFMLQLFYLPEEQSDTQLNPPISTQKISPSMEWKERFLFRCS